MEGVKEVVEPLIRDSYVQVAPNIRLAGQRLTRGREVTFDVPVPGIYWLYDVGGRPLPGRLRTGEKVHGSSVRLERGRVKVRLQSGPAEALLVPQGSYAGYFAPGGDDETLFDDVYN
jgi:hypothetical protein